MCLGIPGKIIEINEQEQWAVIDCFGVQNKVYTPLIDEAIQIGDYLMVHAGYAIGRIDTDEAQKTLELLQEIANVEC